MGFADGTPVSIENFTTITAAEGNTRIVRRLAQSHAAAGVSAAAAKVVVLRGESARVI
jgi:hypothetical protein